jgi:hypothetical protein
MRRSLAGLALLLATAASAQISAIDPDWKEHEAPPPPALRTDGLVPIEVPGSSLRFGVDPASVAVGADGVVRYVVVARGEGDTVNAMYEGVRCKTAEVKVYARHQPGTGWVATRAVDWLPLHDNRHARYSLPIARNGVCMGSGPTGNASEIVRALRSGVDRRFEQR